MSSPQPTLLCRYDYDPLDRLINHTQSDTPMLQRFYCKSHLATEIQGAMQHSIFQHDDQLLAQQQCEGEVSVNTLMATDQQRSVLHTLDKNSVPQPITYSPYGHCRGESGLTSLLGFNGERLDPVTGHYLLGNGYRAFNPVLMRFNSPDSWSPFGAGGLNAYAYCKGDPANRSDKTGHVSGLITAAVDAFLKRVATGRVGKNRAISAPFSTTAGTSAGPESINKHNLQVNPSTSAYSNRTAHARTLTENEATLTPQNLYSVNNNLRELSVNDRAEAYGRAKVGYEFKIHPDVNRPYYMPDPNGGLNIPGLGAAVLDVTHWNVSINYYTTNKLVGRSRYAAHNLIIKRAEYIRKHAGIDLMSIKQ